VIFFDIGFFKECCSLGFEAFLSDGANPENKKF
jgi:hypothetical protein